MSSSSAGNTEIEADIGSIFGAGDRAGYIVNAAAFITQVRAKNKGNPRYEALTPGMTTKLATQIVDYIVSRRTRRAKWVKDLKEHCTRMDAVREGPGYHGEAALRFERKFATLHAAMEAPMGEDLRTVGENMMRAGISKAYGGDDIQELIDAEVFALVRDTTAVAVASLELRLFLDNTEDAVAAVPM